MKRCLPYLLVVSLLSAFALPQTCLACSCARPQRTPAEELARVDAVFRGRVIAIATDERSATKRVTFLVDTIWKGPAMHQRVVITTLHSAACGVEFVQGVEYLVYALAHAGADSSSSLLGTNFCQRTRPVNIAVQDLRELGLGLPITDQGLPALPNTGAGGRAPVPLLTGAGPLVALLAGAGLALMSQRAWRKE